MSRHVKWALNVWPFVFGALLILGAVRVEQWLFPVVEAFSVTDISRESDGIVLRGHTIKTRSCEFVGVTASGSPITGKIALKFMDDDSPGTFPRPTGSQEWGPWKVFVPISPQINSITLTAAHSCHPFWVTRTDLVTIVINGS